MPVRRDNACVHNGGLFGRKIKLRARAYIQTPIALLLSVVGRVRKCYNSFAVCQNARIYRSNVAKLFIHV